VSAAAARAHYVIDWNFDEDRGRIRCGHGPENVSRLRRLNRNVRTVFDYLLMCESARRIPGAHTAAAASQ
jgi:hypothetical protein